MAINNRMEGFASKYTPWEMSKSRPMVLSP